MKILISVLLTIVLCFGFTGCTKNTVEDIFSKVNSSQTQTGSAIESVPTNENSSKTQTGSTIESVTTSKNSSKTQTATYNSTDGTPPVNAEMKTFYKEAADLYYAIQFGAFPVDDDSGVKKGIVMYSRVTDTRFSTKDELKAYLNKYFTKDFIETKMLVDLRDNPKYTDIEGSLYQMQMGRGGKMEYAGHVFGAVIESSSSIKMPVKAYYATDYQPTDFFYTTPKDTSRYQISEYVFELVNENNNWKYSQFYSFV